MAYLVQITDTPLYWVPDDQLAAYVAAGYTAASAGQISAWHAADAYQGRQLAPPAPPLTKSALPTKHVR